MDEKMAHCDPIADYDYDLNNLHIENKSGID